MFFHEVTRSVIFLSIDNKSIIIALTIKLRWRFASEEEAAIFRAAVAGVTHPYSRGVLCILSSLRFWGRREKFISATKIADRQQRRLHYKSHSFSLDKLQQFKDQ